MADRWDAVGPARDDTSTHVNYVCHWHEPSPLVQGIAERVSVEMVSVEVIRLCGQEIACLMDYDLTARLLGLKGERAADTVRRIVQAGELRAVRIRGQVRFKLNDVLDYIERHRS